MTWTYWKTDDKCIYLSFHINLNTCINQFTIGHQIDLYITRNNAQVLVDDTFATIPPSPFIKVIFLWSYDHIFSLQNIKLQCVLIYRISHGLGLDMIFIQRVVCFLPPSFGEGIENFQRVDKNHIQPLNNHGRFFLSHVITPLFSLHNFSVTFKKQKCLTSFQQYCFIVYCDVTAVVYEKFIPWVISTAYWCKNEIIVYIRGVIKKFVDCLYKIKTP